MLFEKTNNDFKIVFQQIRVKIAISTKNLITFSSNQKNQT